MQDILKIVYKQLDDNPKLSCIHVLRKNGRGYRFLDNINDNASELYNILIGKSQKNNKKTKRDKRKKEFIKNIEKNCCFDIANKIEETKENIIAYTDFGKKVYSKKKLTMFWLTHSNDLFFNTFGFSWVPDSKLQELVRKELNLQHFEEKKVIVIDEIKTLPIIPNCILEDICKSINIENVIKNDMFSGRLK